MAGLSDLQITLLMYVNPDKNFNLWLKTVSADVNTSLKGTG